MFAITGITGQVGGQLARKLLSEGHAVRAVLRDAAKASAWRALGCEVAQADMNDAEALTDAFRNAEAVFILLPPLFDPAPGFPESRAVIKAVFEALVAARPNRVLALSTVGAQAERENLLTQLQLLERQLMQLPMPIAFLRAAWFMENSVWDITSARGRGVIDAFLQPADRPLPMVATRDISDAAADLMTRGWSGRHMVEIEGPTRISTADIAKTIGSLLRRDVTVNVVPRPAWEALFRSQGMLHPTPRMRMLDGFNEGWIEFEQPSAAVLHGATSLETVLSGLIGETAY